MDRQTLQYAALGFSALFIGVSKAGFGGGTGLLTGPLLALLFPAKESVGLMLPLLFACDLASLYAYWRKWDSRNVMVIMPGAVVGIIIGTLALDSVSDFLLAKTIGAMAVCFGCLQIYRQRFRSTDSAFEPRWWHGLLTGFGTGFISTLSHVGGVLTTMYLIPQRLDSERFVGTTTLIYFLVNLCKIPSYLMLGMIDGDVIRRDLWLFPIVIAGTALGVYLNRRVPGIWFSRAVLAIVLITGITLLVK